MITGKTRDTRTSMEQGRRRFERWRKTRPPSSPIPQPLWALAVEIARERGVNQAAQ